MPAPDRYRTIAGTVEVEHVVERSRFLTQLVRVPDEASAREVIDVRRREHWSARHHCTAFVIGPDGALQRSNDDGEPAGTAGAPMLEVLRGAEISDVVAVVTRYFGGVKLGTGGLARAYSEATRMALEAATFLTRVREQVCEVAIGHEIAGRVENDLRSKDIAVLETAYAADVRLRLAFDGERRAEVENALAALTGGAVELTDTGTQWVDRS